MILKASEWQKFTAAFPRDLANTCEKNWSEHKARIEQLLTWVDAPFEIEIDIELPADMTPLYYQEQCKQQASQLCSQAAWAVCYKKENKTGWYEEAMPYRNRAFTLAQSLPKFSQTYHQALTHAHYVDAALIRGGSTSPEKLEKSTVSALTALYHYNKSTTNINPETLAHIYNQIGLGLRYIKTENKLELACDYFKKAGDLLEHEAERTYDIKDMTFDTFLAFTEGSVHERTAMNTEKTFSMANEPAPIRAERVLNRALPDTALNIAYKKVSDATALIASNQYDKANQLLTVAYETYCSELQLETNNGLNALLTLIEVRIQLNINVEKEYQTAQAILAKLKYEPTHDYSVRLDALAPNVTSTITPVSSGLSFTLELEQDNTKAQVDANQTENLADNRI